MANNYCLSSSMLPIKKSQQAKARKIVERVALEIENGEDGYCGIIAEVVDDGVWFHADESLTTDHLEQIARALLDELKIDEPFCFSWCYMCDKPRVDEFGGGACIMKRGYDSYWIDAMNHVRNHVFTDEEKCHG